MNGLHSQARGVSLSVVAHTGGVDNLSRLRSCGETRRERMKRLVRKTICFSKSAQMHDIVSGLFVSGVNMAISTLEYYHRFVVLR